MNIDFNRICKLAGIAGSNTNRILRESRYDEMHEEEDADEGMMHEEEDESQSDDNQSELVEVDIGELMSEIRRAKSIMSENKARKQQQFDRKRKIQENKLKRTIAREVQNVLAEIEESDSSWLYGERKPRHSKRGYTNQGRTLPGLGFYK